MELFVNDAGLALGHINSASCISLNQAYKIPQRPC